MTFRAQLDRILRGVAMRRCGVCLTLLAGVIQASAQDATLVPGLKGELQAAVHDTSRADVLARLCFNLINSEPDSARHFGEQALALAVRIGHARAIADAHNNLGWLETQQGNVKAAEEHLLLALDGFRRIGNPGFVSIALSNLGWLAEKQGDRTGALQRFNEALDQATLAADSASMAVLLYSIGSTYNKMRDYSRARQHLERSLTIEEKLDRPNKQGNCLVAIGNAWRSDGDADKAQACYTRAAQLYQATGNHYGAGMVEENTGDLFLEDRPEQALPYYERALAHYDTLHSVADKAYIMRRIGHALLRQQRFDGSAAAYAEAQSLAIGSGSAELEMELELDLAELAVKRGKSDEALAHYQRHMALKDSLQSAEAQRELMRLRAEFETDQAERDNALLKSENELRRLNEERLRNRWIAATAASGLLIALSALLYHIYRSRDRHARQVEAFN
ncbi:MAG: tetratricopeptide repeat protein, partial [Flavobacteriales bacterium]|nr:tetratricopeptide repeat protein [Flavobacteriales bacterium]